MLVLNLRFQLKFNLDTNLATLYDILMINSIAGTNPSYSDLSLTYTNIKGIFKVTAPNGVIYQNTGWATNVFTSPDIDGTILTPITSKTGITLPLDTTTNTPLCGDYIVEYKIDDTVGQYYFTYRVNYCLTLPEVTIEQTTSCRTSQITSVDNTVYDVNWIDNTSLTAVVIHPSVHVRTHTLLKPTGAGCNTPGVSTLDTIVFGGGGTALTDIWTKIWTTTISTTLQYDLENWSLAGYDFVWFYVTYTAKGMAYMDVECDECMCNVRACYNVILTRWLNAIGVNKQEAEQYERIVLKLLGLFKKYELAEACGSNSDMDAACAEIVATINYAACTCDTTDQSVSHHVPMFGQSIQGITIATNVWTSGAGAPSGGNANDFYLQTTTNDVWKNIGGVWTIIANLTGSTGASGVNTNVIYNDISNNGTGANHAATVLKTWTIPAGTLVTNGSYIEITALYKLGLAQFDRTLNISVDGTDYVAEVISNFQISGYNEYEYTIILEKISATKGLIKVIHKSYVGGYVFKLVVNTITITFANTIVVNVSGENDILNAVANDIISEQLKVVQFNK